MEGITCNRCLNEMLCRLNHLLKHQLRVFDYACKVTRNGSKIVDIVTRLRTGQPRNHVRFHGGARDCSFSAKRPLAVGPPSLLFSE
jgi:hypothetical protein